jgi:hypothetical protein
MDTVQVLVELELHPVQLLKFFPPEVAGAVRVMLVPEGIAVLL